MKYCAGLVWVVFGFVLLAGLPRAIEGQVPATQDGLDVYLGQLGLRSVSNGYVISVEGDWGSRTFFFRAEGLVEPLSLIETGGKVLWSPRELLVIAPEAETLIRLAVPDTGGDLQVITEFQSYSPTARRAQLERFNAVSFVENLEGYELVMHSRVRSGLEVIALGSYSDIELSIAVDAARGFSNAEALENQTAPYFNRPPNPPIGGGAHSCDAGGEGSSSCSKTCTSGDSCSITCNSGHLYSCCYCDSGISYCSCL